MREWVYQYRWLNHLSLLELECVRIWKEPIQCKVRSWRTMISCYEFEMISYFIIESDPLSLTWGHFSIRVLSDISQYPAHTSTTSKLSAYSAARSSPWQNHTCTISGLLDNIITMWLELWPKWHNSSNSIFHLPQGHSHKQVKHVQLPILCCWLSFLLWDQIMPFYHIGKCFTNPSLHRLKFCGEDTDVNGDDLW